MIGLGGFLSGRGDERDDRSSTVFVASSREAIDDGWLLRALAFAEERLEQAGVTVKFLPWNVAFEAGDMTADRLINLADTVGAAIVVLTADDVTESRDDKTPAPRDNLVLEAGLFLNSLGFERVLLLREAGSKIPTDLLGVHLPSFRKPVGEDTPSEVALQDLGRSICDFVQSAFAKAQMGADSSVTRAMLKSLKRVDNESVEVRNAILGRTTRQEDPIVLRDAPMAYVDAVHEVKSTFLATTYLDSAFWTMKQLPVIEANKELLDRLADAEGSTARRLILLSQPADEELRAQKTRRRSLRSAHPRQVERMDKEFNDFTKANMNLVNSGFDVRVVYDHNELWKYLPEGMHFSPGDTELAVFDEDRIDIYSGFAKAGLPAAKVFGETTHRRFNAIYELTVTYMNELWESEYAKDFPTFAGELDGVILESQFELDYEPNWLLKYDWDANDGDRRLKQEEMDFVVGILGAAGQRREANRHLDLGTCTGRYVSTLQKFLGATGTSVGIDLDMDCIEHCKRKHSEMLRDERRFRIQHGDIRQSGSLPKESFDVITCMMGTLCHLRRGQVNGGGYDDPWQVGLENLAGRLAMNGDAFVAIWNTEKTTHGSAPQSLLSIYPQRSKDILLKQSPLKDEFEARLRQAKLQPVADRLLGDQLHVYHLQHA